MPDEHDLARFVTAQESVFTAVLEELESGRKRSHWMWFVFPQLRGLGRSETARRYGIASLHEARAYVAHPVLGPRLLTCTHMVNAVQGRSANDIFGSPDDLKLHSSMTLFAQAAPDQAVFNDALDTYFDGQPDQRTLARLSSVEI